MPTFAEYLATVTDAAERDALAHAWSVAAQTAPDAAEGQSYGMPALVVDGKALFAVQASKRHLALYPFSPPVLDAVEDRLGGLTRTKGSLQFSPATPVPDDLLVEIVTLRRAEIAG